MGKASNRKKSRRERLDSPLARTAVKIAARGGVVSKLQAASTEDQIETLGATVSASKLGKALMRKAPGEMDKGIKAFRKLGKPVTVKNLLQDVRTTPGFLKMSEDAGVPYEWYENLAKERMMALGGNQ